MAPYHSQSSLTPLHLACQEGHLNIAELLVSHDASVGAETRVSTLHIYILANGLGGCIL